MSGRLGISLAMVAVAAAICAPGASPAKSKAPIYAVSFSGDVRNDVTSTQQDAVTPPPGCTGSMSDTQHFVASTDLAAKPGRGGPIASYGRVIFRSVLKSPKATSTSDTSGSFSPDPDFPPSDPSSCNVQPRHKNFTCRFSSAATRKSGAEFALLPHKGHYELYYNRVTPIVSCNDDIHESLLDANAPKQTKLRVSAVKGLGKGKSVSVSGTATTPPADSQASGGETLHYTIKVKRVR